MVKYLERDLDAVFSALAHPVRRRMLERLSRGEASVGELAEPFGLTAPAISRHLRVLERARLLVRKRDGRVHRLDLAGGSLAGAMGWIDRHHRFWSARLDRLVALLEDPTPKEEDAWPRRPPSSERSSSSNARSRRRPTPRSRRSRDARP